MLETLKDRRILRFFKKKMPGKKEPGLEKSSGPAAVFHQSCSQNWE
jgi:hypothetical protein